MIKSIVTAVDGSEHADKALSLAIDLAERYGARLTIVHVFMKNMSLSQLERFADHAHLKDIVAAESDRIAEFMTALAGAPGTAYVPPPSDDAIRQVADVVLADARAAAEAALGRPVNTVCLDGRPADRILAQAEEEKADMIVLGSRGLGEWRSLLLGSTSHEVAHMAECTCVTVK